MIEKLLDIIFPKRCPFCGKATVYLGEPVCKSCLEQQKKVEAPQCMKCGKTIEDEELELCMDCTKVPKTFMRGFPVFEYEGKIKNSIYEFKYKNQRYYSSFFADCIYFRYKNAFQYISFDGIVPIPVHPKKKRKRGYNQADLIARDLSKRMKVPVYDTYIRRIINTNPQKELNDKARMKNLKNAFIIGTNTIKLKKVLLVDDIYTTGATIEACTRVLLDAGVEEVYYTSVAIGRGY